MLTLLERTGTTPEGPGVTSHDLYIGEFALENAGSVLTEHPEQPLLNHVHIWQRTKDAQAA